MISSFLVSFMMAVDGADAIRPLMMLSRDEKESGRKKTMEDTDNFGSSLTTARV
jgi:hypothetical protein